MRKVIFDVDTGSDDALELIYACRSGKLDIIGITTVFGSYPVNETTRHTLQIMDLLSCDVPVYEGCQRSLVRHLYPKVLNESLNRIKKKDRTIGYHEVFSDSVPIRVAQKKHAVSFLVDSLRSSKEQITVVASGALTNIAAAFRLAPEIKDKIKQIVIMGGGINYSNKTMGAESNFYRDPEAARIVLESGCYIVLIPLDATMSVPVGKAEMESIKKLNCPISDFICSVIEMRIEAYDDLQRYKEKGRAFLHDLLCTFYLLNDDVFSTMEHRHATVSISHDEAAGKLIVDQRHESIESKIKIATAINNQIYNKMLIDSLNL